MFATVNAKTDKNYDTPDPIHVRPKAILLAIISDVAYKKSGSDWIYLRLCAARGQSWGQEMQLRGVLFLLSVWIN